MAEYIKLEDAIRVVAEYECFEAECEHPNASGNADDYIGSASILFADLPTIESHTVTAHFTEEQIQEIVDRVDEEMNHYIKTHQPCEDAISRSKLKEELEAWAVNLGNPTNLVREDTFIIIDDMPSVVVADRPRGEWVEYKDDKWEGGGYWDCSNCRHAYAFGSGDHESYPFDFCPNCGAKMVVNTSQTYCPSCGARR